MRRVALLILAAGMLSGCEGMNDAMVRRWHMDRQLGTEMNDQIQEGYRRRMEVPPAPATAPKTPAPTGLDQG
ncbi:hypothetical protein LPW11_15425 [Geomonas sp. RF6]|uniref:hypothetical protein n=1 Tax=Geomonas sp. RF6 TaxID=2897342 RepID=UPI001E5842E0|nr:hypothetical protein [Geomonas sp. RF6]UFS69281.1 hypothetical protein LPW11_15425 [Geomonas sp. RF6]